MLAFTPCRSSEAGVFRIFNASLVGNAMSTFALSVGIAHIVEYNDTISLNQSTSFVDFIKRQNHWSFPMFQHYSNRLAYRQSVHFWHLKPTTSKPSSLPLTI